MIKLVTAFLMRVSLLMLVPLTMLVSACAPELTAGDMAFCRSEFRAATDQHNDALVEADNREKLPDKVIKSADKLFSLYDAACHG